MRGSFVGFVALLLGAYVSCTAEANKTARAAKSRSRSTSWRVVVCLSQPQAPLRLEMQKAWDSARLESSKTDLELSYVETRAPTLASTLSYPLSLLEKFCTDIEAGRTVLSVVVGGGSAARFVITAAASLNLPTLWIPFTHRDFLRQGRQQRFETRLGSSAREVGSAAAVLMHKANWHAFTLLVDTTLLPVSYLLQTPRVNLTPRTIIHLPTNEKTLWLRLRRISEQGGSGNVLVMGCDLSTARKIIDIANKFDMVSGRFLWLWLDLKAELRSAEPNLVPRVVHGGRVPVVGNENAPQLKTPDEKSSLFPENVGQSLHILPNLENDVHQLQEYWLKRERVLKKREDKDSHFEEEYEEDQKSDKSLNPKNFMPAGMLALRPASVRVTGGGDTVIAKTFREMSQALDESIFEAKPRLGRLRDSQIKEYFVPDCYSSITARFLTNDARENVSKTITRRLRRSMRQISKEKAEFHLLNLQGIIFPGNKTQLRWTKVGSVRGGKEVRLDTIIWPGGGIVPAYMSQGGEKIGMPSYRIVTALAPPFAMVTNLQEGLCLRGVICSVGNDVKCCYGYSMDLLKDVSRELEFRYSLYVAKDGFFGKRSGRSGSWNGIMGELMSGRAQMAFAPMSVSTRRAEVVDFTIPYFFSSVSFLTAPKHRSDISLLAFLQPFSTELWIAVFTSLNITAMAVAAYEWLSPFGLNPWGRQRSRNFSIASALWVMWGLLCGHLVAFKAPKSWPNKFLINIWGGFSVIFVASYTANIAALIAGLFFHSSVDNYGDRSLLSQKVGAPKASVAEWYVQKATPQLWSHMARYSIANVADGVERLRNGTLDVLIADTPILDYYRATDNGCRLQKIGDAINEDTYAVALTKGHPLKETISRLIANYTSSGALDILQEKWYGDLPCLRDGVETNYNRDHGGQPRPLGVASVAGVFCLLGLGMVVGILILAGEHLFYKYTLPRLRRKPKTSMWRSRNVMFFSQKLYRFINCVELVSPHHAARELVHTVRQGQITSLFQKSVKRKEHEQRRRRKSKAQFFEMIQEIRRVQQEEKEIAIVKEAAAKREEKKNRERSQSKSPLMPCSPKRTEKSRSSTNLSGSRLGLSLEAPLKPREFTLSNTNLRARSPLETVGRRLSHGDRGSPPQRFGSNFGGSANLRVAAFSTTPRSDSVSIAVPTPRQSRSPAKRGQSFPVFATPRPAASSSRQQSSKSPLLSPNSEMTAAVGRRLSREWGSGILDITRSSEAIGSTSTFTLNQETPRTMGRKQMRKKSQGDVVPMKQPIRRARSHENKDAGKLMPDLPEPARFAAQPIVGGKNVSERTKKQLESELKAILTARAHHFELHPP